MQDQELATLLSPAVCQTPLTIHRLSPLRHLSLRYKWPLELSMSSQRNVTSCSPSATAWRIDCKMPRRKLALRNFRGPHWRSESRRLSRSTSVYLQNRRACHKWWRLLSAPDLTKSRKRRLHFVNRYRQGWCCLKTARFCSHFLL